MEIKIEEAQDAPSRISMILWGDAGCGKTTLAATAPGKKLFLLFDPDGDLSIRSIPYWSRIDMTREQSVDIAKECLKPNPFGLEQLLADYNTLIIDSLTKVSEHALNYSVSIMPKSTIMMPGINGYGGRNTVVGSLVSNALRITSKLNKHIIMTTHERDADRNEQGNIIGVSMLLGGQLPNITSKDISEVWNMRDQGGRRFIAVRPERFRSPMKTRMFTTSGTNTSFEWKYDIGKPDHSNTLEAWWLAFNAAHVKLPLPR